MNSPGHRRRHLVPVRADDPPRAPPALESVRLAELVARAKHGDTPAWACLYRELFVRLYRHVGYLTHDPMVAEDLAQEAFARAFANLHRFDELSSFSTWLHGIAINLVRKHWRETARRERAHARLESHVPVRGLAEAPDGAHLRSQRARALLGVLEQLPTNLREAYVLCDLRQLPREEAAAQLGITVGNLSVRAARARVRIRSELSRLGWIPSEPRGRDG